HQPLNPYTRNKMNELTTRLACFITIVGIGSTIALDLWGLLISRLTGRAASDWGLVGRWLLGITRGNWVLDRCNENRPNALEKIMGWGFHYLVGLIYAALLPLLWGADYIAQPSVFPVFVIGVVVSSLAGLLILTPGMGGGVLASRTPNPAATISYVLVAHLVFAVAQYLLALGFA
ncbi:hypothetical protein A11A3_16777, partial [Alcanivorax hongdengensis A-11-3]